MIKYDRDLLRGTSGVVCRAHATQLLRHEGYAVGGRNTLGVLFIRKTPLQ